MSCTSKTISIKTGHTLNGRLSVVLETGSYYSPGHTAWTGLEFCITRVSASGTVITGTRLRLAVCYHFLSFLVLTQLTLGAQQNQSTWSSNSQASFPKTLRAKKPSVRVRLPDGELLCSLSPDQADWHSFQNTTLKEQRAIPVASRPSLWNQELTSEFWWSTKMLSSRTKNIRKALSSPKGQDHHGLFILISQRLARGRILKCKI